MKGRNGKGTMPTLRLEPARIGIVINAGEPGAIVVDVAEPAARDSIELALGAMRLVDGTVTITRPRGGAAIDLATLARRHGPKKPPRKPLPRRRGAARARAVAA